MAKLKKVKIEFEVLDLGELSEIELALINKAKQALDNAYAPYSEFHVGAAVLVEDETIILGNNQENAAYPSGLCAERVALFHVGANHPDKKILKLAVAAKPINSPDFVQAGPCGSCRQVMFEYQNNQQEPIEVLLVQPNNEVIKVKVNNLLPLAFDKSSFKK